MGCKTIEMVEEDVHGARVKNGCIKGDNLLRERGEKKIFFRQNA